MIRASLDVPLGLYARGCHAHLQIAWGWITKRNATKPAKLELSALTEDIDRISEVIHKISQQFVALRTPRLRNTSIPI